MRPRDELCPGRCGQRQPLRVAGLGDHQKTVVVGFQLGERKFQCLTVGDRSVTAVENISVLRSRRPAEKVERGWVSRYGKRALQAKFGVAELIAGKDLLLCLQPAGCGEGRQKQHSENSI